MDALAANGITYVGRRRVDVHRRPPLERAETVPRVPKTRCAGCTRRGCAAGCCGGLLVGGLLALFVSFLVAASNPCVHLPIALLVQIVLFVVCLAVCPCIGCGIACRANRRPQVLLWMRRDGPRAAALVALSAFLLACVVALSVPSLARYKLFVVFGAVSQNSQSVGDLTLRGTVTAKFGSLALLL